MMSRILISEKKRDILFVFFKEKHVDKSNNVAQNVFDKN